MAEGRVRGRAEKDEHCHGDAQTATHPLPRRTHQWSGCPHGLLGGLHAAQVCATKSPERLFISLPPQVGVGR